MTRSLQAKVLILAIFVIGALTGAVLADVYQTHVQSASVDQQRPERARRPENFQSFQDFLGLDEEQNAQLDGILQRSGERYRELRAQTLPMYDEIREESQAEIRGILTDEQLERYNEWIRRIEEFRANSRGRGGRGRENAR